MTKRKLKQLKTGVHLVCITDADLIKDDNKKPIKTKDGETGIAVRFSTGDNQHFDHDYWINGSRHSFFLKMCASAKIDHTSLKFKAEAIGKRLWICIKEVHDIDGDKPVFDEQGEPIINYYLFDTIPCLDPNKRPIVNGDPGLDEMASGTFLDYKQINYSEQKVLSPMVEKLKENLNVLPEKENIFAKKNYEAEEKESTNDPINWDEF